MIKNFKLITGAPSGSGYTKIFSNEKAFTAVKADGSITAWGDSNFGGTIQERKLMNK
jgi:hypothetical protein